MNRFSKFLLTVTVLMAAGALAWAQATVSGTISGTVKDPTGAVIPGVEVTITEQDTGVSRVVLTDDEGFYTAPNVPVGTYTVSASMPGFKPAAVKDVKVDIRANRVINLVLEVGELTEEVTVTSASMAQVELRSA
ncbi:MAG TPA: carboxypeptidase-like regulatory domain-containing protein, partial [Acidobacteriota bacterium]|nr:carboxypeptidase-like regulatory domain-containing protein [Acidobacteriota bacterium]